MERAMTVRELIGLLEAQPPDLRVVVQGYEDGYDDIGASAIRPLKLALDVDEREYVGDHQDAEYLSSWHATPSAVVDALALHRTSH